MKDNLTENIDNEKAQAVLTQSHCLSKQLLELLKELGDGAAGENNVEMELDSPLSAKFSRVKDRPSNEDNSTRATSPRTRSGTGATQFSITQTDSLGSRKNSIFQNSPTRDGMLEFLAEQEKIEETVGDSTTSLDSLELEHITSRRRLCAMGGKNSTRNLLVAARCQVPEENTRSDSARSSVFSQRNSLIPERLSLVAEKLKEQFEDDDYDVDDNEENEEIYGQNEFHENDSKACSKRLSRDNNVHHDHHNVSLGLSASHSGEFLNNFPTVKSFTFTSKNSSKRYSGRSQPYTNENSSLSQGWESIVKLCALNTSSRGKTFMVKFNDELTVLKQHEVEKTQQNLERLEEIKSAITLLKELNLDCNVEMHFVVTPKNQPKNKAIIEYGIIMEYMAGGDLEDYLNENIETMSFEKKRLIAKKLLLALNELHENEVTHGNLKLRNCLLSNNHQQIKLSDLSMVSQNPGISEDMTVKELKFKAPELLNGEDIDDKSDIWSLGMCLLAIFGSAKKGKPTPYSFMLTPTSLQAEIDKAVLHLNTSEKESKRLLKEVLSRCLAWDPKERLNSKELLNHAFFEENFCEGDSLGESFTDNL